MTLQVKSVLTVILTAIVGLVSAWVSRAITRNGSVLIPAVFLTAAVLCQIALVIFVHSKEEEELDLAREMRMARGRQALAESEQMSTRIQREVKNGKIETAVEIINIRDQLL
jgi:hypothetical protein